MDFEFTSRPSANMKAAWVEDPNSTPRKRTVFFQYAVFTVDTTLTRGTLGTHDHLNSPAPAFPAPSQPTPFGLNQSNTPFLFHTPPPRTQQVPDWAPPPHFSPSKAFPIPPEPNDVHMADVSPPKPSESKSGEGQRAVALGAMRRVFKSRQRARDHKLVRNLDAPASGSESSDNDDGDVPPMTHSTSHHYTLNMAAAALPQSETPYVLLGCVSSSDGSFAVDLSYNRYLQFFFNLCLISVFLYLVVLFILTVQRDVEQRISEYSMGASCCVIDDGVQHLKSTPLIVCQSNSPCVQQIWSRRLPCAQCSTRITFARLTPFRRWHSNVASGRHACSVTQPLSDAQRLGPNSSQKSSTDLWILSAGRLWLAIPRSSSDSFRC